MRAGIVLEEDLIWVFTILPVLMLTRKDVERPFKQRKACGAGIFGMILMTLVARIPDMEGWLNRDSGQDIIMELKMKNSNLNTRQSLL